MSSCDDDANLNYQRLISESKDLLSEKRILLATKRAHILKAREEIEDLLQEEQEIIQQIDNENENIDRLYKAKQSQQQQNASGEQRNLKFEQQRKRHHQENVLIAKQQAILDGIKAKRGSTVQSETQACPNEDQEEREGECKQQFIPAPARTTIQQPQQDEEDYDDCSI